MFSLYPSHFRIYIKPKLFWKVNENENFGSTSEGRYDLELSSRMMVTLIMLGSIGTSYFPLDVTNPENIFVSLSLVLNIS